MEVLNNEQQTDPSRHIVEENELVGNKEDVLDDDELRSRQVEFQVSDKRSAEQFEAAVFLAELRALSDNLQSVLRRQLVDDLEAERLDKMVMSVTSTLDNFKTYSNCVRQTLESVRDQMKNVSELVFKMVFHPALIGYGHELDEKRKSLCFSAVYFLLLR